MHTIINAKGSPKNGVQPSKELRCEVNNALQRLSVGFTTMDIQRMHDN